MIAPVVQAPRTAWRDGTRSSGTRLIAQETAVALTYNRVTHAVMMATPADLEDFAVGFSLAERIVSRPADIEELDVIPVPQGIELRMTIGADRNARYTERRRAFAGPTGCGLCGMESLEQAMAAPPAVTSDLRVTTDTIKAAITSIPARQIMNLQTHAIYAAAYWGPGQGLIALREDVGRHNAVDKLGGALARADISPARGLLMLTSRVSVELIQKAAVMGAPIVVAVSAPTGLAVRVADACGITLVAVAREDGFEVFTHAERIIEAASEHVA